MSERVLKFIIMIVAVVVVGTGVTLLNLNLRRNAGSRELSQAADFAKEETARMETGAGNVKDEAAGAALTDETMAEIPDGTEAAGAEAGGAETEAAEQKADGAVSRDSGAAEDSAVSESLAVADSHIDTKQAEGSSAVWNTEESLTYVLEVIESSEDYYNRLSETDKKLTAKADEASKKNVADQKAVTDEALKFWDDELNDMYQNLRRTLSEDEFSKLREEERAWIRSRDEAANQAAAVENYSTSYQSLSYTRSLVEWTRNRVYELAEIYYGQ